MAMAEVIKSIKEKVEWAKNNKRALAAVTIGVIGLIVYGSRNYFANQNAVDHPSLTGSSNSGTPVATEMSGNYPQATQSVSAVQSGVNLTIDNNHYNVPYTGVRDAVIHGYPQDIDVECASINWSSDTYYSGQALLLLGLDGNQISPSKHVYVAKGKNVIPITSFRELSDFKVNNGDEICHQVN